MTKEQEQYILDNYIELGPDRISNELGLTYNQVRHFARKNGVFKFKQMNWTDKMDDIIIEKYPWVPGPELAKELAVSLHALYKRAEMLEIVKSPSHITKDGSGYLVHTYMKDRRVYRKAIHREVMESYLGRKLKSTEIVHHIDGDKLNNSKENLVITNRAEHIDMHRADIYKAKMSNKI